MRLLHTADWHIGKRLHQQDLKEDFDRFSHWLIQTVQNERIDLLLVSGDIFDLANPSSVARKQYYQVLRQLMQLNCSIILTGGNHDSPAMLNAPKELLSALDIHIVGSLPERWAEVLIPIGEGPEVVVAAVPFLRDADLVKYAPDETYEQRQEAVRSGIERVFTAVADIAAAQFPGVPLIGMGHLFTANASTSESERDIQVGNLGAYPVSQFPEIYDYIALGHIHKPQQPGERVWYSGSPLALSFSEYKDEKRVLLYDTETQKVEPIQLPVFRQLIRVTGTIAVCKELLANITVEQDQLEAWVEVEVRENERDPQKRLQVESMVEDFNALEKNARIIKHKLHFEKASSDTRHLFDAESDTIQELSPAKVFASRIEAEELSNRSRQLLQSAFEELLQEVQQSAT